MFESLKKILGIGPEVNYKELINQGAFILDVRTASEFNGGHIKGAINIPVDQIVKNLNKLQKNKAIITCCASGMRSASAKSLLKSNGFVEVYNGGGWNSLQSKLI